jgi:hypothetical protein
MIQKDKRNIVNSRPGVTEIVVVVVVKSGFVVIMGSSILSIENVPDDFISLVSL